MSYNFIKHDMLYIPNGTRMLFSWNDNSLFSYAIDLCTVPLLQYYCKKKIA